MFAAHTAGSALLHLVVITEMLCLETVTNSSGLSPVVLCRQFANPWQIRFVHSHPWEDVATRSKSYTPLLITYCSPTTRCSLRIMSCKCPWRRCRQMHGAWTWCSATQATCTAASTTTTPASTTTSPSLAQASLGRRCASRMSRSKWRPLPR